MREALRALLGDESASGFLRSVKSDCLAEKLSADGLRRLIHLLVLSTHYDAARAGQLLSKG